MQFHPPPRTGGGLVECRGHRFEWHPQDERGGGCGRGIGDLVLADQPQLHLGAVCGRSGSGDGQHEGVAVEIVRLQIRGPDEQFGVDGFCAADHEAGDAGLGAWRHGIDERVAGIENGPAVRVERLDDLPLGFGGPRLAAELAEVRGADVQHDGHAGVHDRAEVGDVADRPGAHLADQIAGPLVDLADGERIAQLVVVGTGRADRRADGGQDLGQEVFGAGLAGAAGDRDRL